MADGDAAEVELEEIRCRNRVIRVFSDRRVQWTLLREENIWRHEHPINKDLIAHFKSKGDSVSWGIAESIKKYEEDTEKFVLRGADIAALYDQETERELAKEVENRIEEALSADVWKSCTAAAAARGGHLERLKHLHENGYPWDKWACTRAARGGHLECLKYLHENGCPCDESACAAAAEDGDVEFLKYLHENGCPWDERSCLAATEGGHLECLKYLHEHVSRKRKTSS